MNENQIDGNAYVKLIQDQIDGGEKIFDLQTIMQLLIILDYWKDKSKKLSADIMLDFEWCKKLLENMCGYSITVGKDGEHKVVWMEGGEHFEEYLTDDGVIAIVEQMCEEDKPTP